MTRLRYYAELVVSMYPDQDFLRHFRLSRTTFEVRPGNRHHVLSLSIRSILSIRYEGDWIDRLSY